MELCCGVFHELTDATVSHPRTEPPGNRHLLLCLHRECLHLHLFSIEVHCLNIRDLVGSRLELFCQDLKPSAYVFVLAIPDLQASSARRV